MELLKLALQLCCLFSLQLINAGHAPRLEQSEFLRKLLRYKRAGDMNRALNYLSTYGYIPQIMDNGRDVAGLVSMSEALTEFQEFFGLSRSGELDKETLALMQKPRCANPDKFSSSSNLHRNKRYVTVDAKWHQRELTYSIDNYTPKLGERRTHEAIDAAFAVWEKYIPLQFRKVSKKDRPDIKTFFAEGNHNDNTAFDGPGGFLAHAYYPGSGIGGDTHFDEAELWTLHEKPYQGNDLFLVAVHELGHALGLAHSPIRDAIMAPVYKYHNTRNFELPLDDIHGIQSIYGKRYDKPYRPIIPTTSRPSYVPPTSPKYNPHRTRKPYGRPRPPPPRHPIPPTTESSLPDVCTLTQYDAVSFLRRELYVFSGKYMWRRQLHESSMQGPYEITSFWAQLKNGVDAAYENPVTNRIIFFKDHEFWEYDGIRLQQNSPRPVRFLGLQNERIGAAAWWRRNHKSYFFQGTHYWRFSGSNLDPGYPLTISQKWKGVPSYIDAAFTEVYDDGRNYTYFVKGSKYWKFDNKLMMVVEEPQSFKEDWLKCDVSVEKNKVAQEDTSYVLPLVFGCVGACAILAIVIFIILKQRNDGRLTRSSLMTSQGNSKKKQLPENVNKYTHGKKPMYVKTAQKKIRWFRFNFQEKV